MGTKVADFNHIKYTDWWKWVEEEVDALREASVNRLITAENMESVCLERGKIKALSTLMGIITDPVDNSDTEE